MTTYFHQVPPPTPDTHTQLFGLAWGYAHPQDLFAECVVQYRWAQIRPHTLPQTAAVAAWIVFGSLPQSYPAFARGSGNFCVGKQAALHGNWSPLGTAWQYPAGLALFRWTPVLPPHEAAEPWWMEWCYIYMCMHMRVCHMWWTLSWCTMKHIN